MACVETGTAMFLRGFSSPPGRRFFIAPDDLCLFIAALSLYALLSIPTALVLAGLEKVCSLLGRKTKISCFEVSPMEYWLLLGWGLLFFKWISTLLPYISKADHLPMYPYLLLLPLLGMQLWLTRLLRNRKCCHLFQWIVIALGAVFLSKTSYEIFIRSSTGMFVKLVLFIFLVMVSLLLGLIFHAVLKRTMQHRQRPSIIRILFFTTALLAGLLVTFDSMDLKDCTQSSFPQEALATAVESDLKKNVIVILVDCLRPDHLGCYGYPRETSPFFDQLARSGLKFENCIAASSWTIPSVASLFTGVYPQRHGVNKPGTIIPGKLILLQELLQKRGMETAAFITNDYLEGRWGYARGFNRYFDCYLRRSFIQK